MSGASYIPANGGCVLPIARLGRLGWFVEGQTASGLTWTMQPRGGCLTLDQQKAIAVACAAALRRLGAEAARASLEPAPAQQGSAHA